MLRIAILLLAVVSGGAAAWITYIGQGDDAPPDPEVVVESAPTMRILVAASDIDRATRLEASDMEWRSWPAENVSDDYIEESARPEAPETLDGRMARGFLNAGEPILEGKLLQTDASFLSTVLGPGERAVAVRISAEKTAGGFILPGDRVDVLHTGRNEADGTVPSRAILRNVEVLAIDQTLEDPAEAASTQIGQTATLRVDLDQAERLAAARITGDLSLALRASADNGVTEPQVVAEASYVRTITVRRGGQTEEVDLE